MGGFFAGVANAPIAAVIIVCEMTGSYELLAPLMAVAMISLIFSHKFNIYPGQKLNKFHSPAHAWDMTNDFLMDLKIEDAINPEHRESILDEFVMVKDLYQISRETQQSDFIITENKTRKYLGILSLRHVYQARGKEFSESRRRVGEIIEEKIPPLKTEDSLSTGLQNILNRDLDKMPVVDNTNVLIGYLTFRDILDSYNKRVNKKK
jgi:CIC family chloride channel protein